jgi:hypothetical protein
LPRLAAIFYRSIVFFAVPSVLGIRALLPSRGAEIFSLFCLYIHNRHLGRDISRMIIFTITKAEFFGKVAALEHDVRLLLVWLVKFRAFLLKLRDVNHKSLNMRSRQRG